MFYFNQVISNEQPQWLELQSECLVASRLNNSGQGPSYPMVQFLLSKMREGRRNNKYFHRWTVNWIRCWVVKSTLVGNRSYLYKSGDGMNIESSPSLCSETSYIYRNHQAQGITYVIVGKIISCPLLTLAGWLDGMHAFGFRYGILTLEHPQWRLRLQTKLLQDRNPPSSELYLFFPGYGGGDDNSACQMPSSSVSLFNPSPYILGFCDTVGCEVARTPRLEFKTA